MTTPVTDTYIHIGQVHRALLRDPGTGVERAVAVIETIAPESVYLAQALHLRAEVAAELDAFYALFERDGGRRNLHRLIRYMEDRREHRERRERQDDRMGQHLLHQRPDRPIRAAKGGAHQGGGKNRSQWNQAQQWH